MNRQPDQGERAIFLAALEEPSPARREALIARACGNDSALLARVRALLASHDESRGPLDAPPPGVGNARTNDVPMGERPGTQIGPYKLLQQIGEGGFGVVYAAEQQAPVRRKVALKIVKAGMDTREVIARFEAERQALAMMDHPNIAQVLGAGTTDQGRPYFVMELVRGVPITEYCDAHHLTMRQRLDLFVEVCHAVQHAHQKGIIHRDIKPSNTLVALHDGRPVPKVIDFGVSKALNQQLTEKTLFTAYGQMIGTPQYMSPEQAEMSGLDIDTRSDVYSLGVLLYEMLTGTTPLDGTRLHAVGYAEIQRMIREDEPPKPSTRVSTLGEQATVIARHRSVEPRRLSDQLRGELDWIVMRAIDKERGRRYDTANALAEDIERYMRDEAVAACPPSIRYRLRKIARRNRALLSVATGIGSLLIAVMVLNSLLALQAHRAGRVAEERRVSERTARETADAARRSEAAHRDVTMRQRDAAIAAEQEAARQREAAVAAERQAEAHFRQARRAVDQYLATIRHSSLLADTGTRPLRDQLLESARTFYQSIVEKATSDEKPSADVASAQLRRGQILEDLGDRDAARDAYRAARALLDEIALRAPTPEVQLERAEACLALGEPTQAMALAQALLDAEPSLTEARRLLHRAHVTTAQSQASAGDRGAALASFRAAQALLEPLTSVEAPTAADLAALATVRLELGDFHRRQPDVPAALVATRGAIEAAERAREREPQTARYGELVAMGSLRAARLLVVAEQTDEAVSAYRRAITTWSKLAFEHPTMPQLKADVLRTSRELTALQQSLQRLDDAAVTRRRADQYLAELPRSLGEDFYQLAVVYAQLAAPQAEGEPNLILEDDAQRGDHATRAIELLRQAVEMGYRPSADLARDPFLRHLSSREDFGRVVALAVTPLAVGDEGAGVGPRAGAGQPVKLQLLTVAGLRGIANAHRELAQLDQAQATLDQCFTQLDDLERKYPAAAADIRAERGQTHYALGYVHWRARRYPQARAAWEQGFELLSQVHAEATGPRRQELAATISHEQLDLINVYGRVGAWREAARHRTRYIASDRFTTPAWEARFAILTLVADAGESYEDACRFLMEKHAKQDPTHVAWALLFGPQTVLDAAGLIELARQKGEAAKPGSFANNVLVVCQRRAQEGEEALKAIGPSVRELFERAVVLHRLGDEAAARFALEMGERLYAPHARNWLASGDLELPDGPWASRGYWWEECITQVWRARAREAVAGAGATDPWATLFDARSQALVGHAAESQAAFEAAVNLTPGDVRVWIASAECRAALGQFTPAEEDFARALELEPENAAWWIARGRSFLERGLDAQADADYRRAAELSGDDLDLFVRTGVWAVGPFPAAMNQALPPEKQPHPARDVAARDNAGDPDVEQLQWKRVSVSCEDNNWGQVSLGVVTKDTANTSAYALAIVYAPEPRTASLMIASPQHRRVWVNDVCVYDNPTANDTMELLECVPISLQPGRNNIVVRISTKATQCHFLLRLGDGPMERALVAARLMQWEQAAAAFEQIPPQELVRAGHLWAIYCQCLAAARDSKRHARAVAIEYTRCRSVREEFLLSELLRAGSMLPNDQLTSEVLHAILTDLGEPARDWQRIAKGRALYRAGEYAEAINYYSRQTNLAGNEEVQPVTAMAYHRLGQAAEAEATLRTAQQQFTEWITSRVDKPGFEATWPMHSARRWALLQEALELIRGEALTDDSVCQQLMRKVENELAAIRPELADHDRALMFQPNEPRLWLARGQRLAELSRWDEAESDFAKATSLKTDGPFIWLAIAQYWLARANVPQASAACVRALELDLTRQWMHVAHQVFSEHDDLLTAVLAARPRDADLWTVRGAQLCAASRWADAAQVWQRRIELGEDTHMMWYQLALLQAGAGDAAGQAATCQKMLERFGAPDQAVSEAANFAAWACAVSPGVLSDYAATESLAQRFVDAHIAQPLAHTTLGAVYLRSGKPDAAVPALVLADELNGPDDPTSATASAYAWYLLAIAHGQLGQLDDARRWHERATSWMTAARAEQAQGTRAPWPWNRRLTLELLEREAAQVLPANVAERATSS
ncbi:MAG: protein kinase domain-containing protein [Pirellulaceae bacterium]